MASISAFEPQIHKGLLFRKKGWKNDNWDPEHMCTKLFGHLYKMFWEMLDLPIVDIANEECTRINVEQLASTRATSAIEIALAVSESPGHPYPCKFEGKKNQWNDVQVDRLYLQNRAHICLVATFIVPPAKPRLARLGMAWNGNSAFSQYCRVKWRHLSVWQDEAV